MGPNDGSKTQHDDVRRWVSVAEARDLALNLDPIGDETNASAVERVVLGVERDTITSGAVDDRQRGHDESRQ